MGRSYLISWPQYRRSPDLIFTAEPLLYGRDQLKITCNPPSLLFDRSLTLRNAIPFDHPGEHVLEYVETPVADVQRPLTSTLKPQETLYFNGCHQPSETARNLSADLARRTEVAKAAVIKMDE
jgi:hypothetical protein